MATKPNVTERVAVLETKVDDLKESVTTMREENREDHGKVMAKLDNLRDLKNYVLGATAIGATLLAWIATQIDWQQVFR
jgi:hypothetical protein